MTGEILFIAHRLPFPPDRGDKIRSHHILKRLAAMAPVHVATFADRRSDWAHEASLAELAASHCLVKRSKPVPLAGIEALLRGEPISLAAFRDHALSAYIARLLSERPMSAIYVFSGQMGHYVPADYRGRLVVDLVDVDSAKFGAYAQAAAFPLSWMHAREERLLRAEEERLAHRADHTLLVSRSEAQLLQSRLSDPVGTDISALRNGIDADTFDPAKVDPHPALASGDGPHIVFTGQMDYPPNVAAVERVAQRILPAIRVEFAQAQFHIVGRAPTREVQALEAEAGCRVWGEVPDVKPFLAGADLVAAPLEIARGVQNKVLEAMAMARPCLLSPGAAAGIEAQDGIHFAVAQEDAALIARALELLGNPAMAAAMGAAARQYVRERQSWPAMLNGLEALMGFPGDGTGNRHAN